MAAQFALKDTPTLSSAESKELVHRVIKTPLTAERKETLVSYAKHAKEAFSRPIKR